MSFELLDLDQKLLVTSQLEIQWDPFDAHPPVAIRFSCYRQVVSMYDSYKIEVGTKRQQGNAT